VIVGDYNGNAKASKSVELRAPAKVRGTLTTASIVIERGVFFEGNCKMDTSSAGAVSQITPPPSIGNGNKPKFPAP
jgi:cytoskeletal protein CcmA (bactofilin family)